MMQLHQAQSNIILWELIEKINNNTLVLASLPDIIASINQNLANEFVNTSDVAAIIQRDVSLSTRLLRIANSPALRARQEITSILSAINRLGINMVKNLALCVALKDKFSSGNLVFQTLMDDYIDSSVRHSAICLLVTKALNPKISQDSTMIAGLLGKIGHIVALRYINDSPEYSKMPAFVVSKIVDEMGPSIGLLLLQKWGLPIDVIDCIYGDATGSYDPPITRRDVFEVTRLYLEFTHRDSEHLPVFDTIDNLLIQYSHDFNDLISLSTKN